MQNVAEFPRLEMSDRHLTEVLSIIAEQASGMEVLAFGSRVSGGAQECSDLDLVLRDPMDPSRETGRAAALRQAFVESRLPFSVDVHEWALIPESFRRSITRCCLDLPPAQAPA